MTLSLYGNKRLCAACAAPVLILAALVLLPAVATCAPAAADAAAALSRTLSIRTSDGLAVIEGTELELFEIKQKLRLARDDRPATNKQLFSWLVSNAVDAANVRIYVKSTPQTEQARGIPASELTETTVAGAEASGLIPAISGMPLHEAYMTLRAAGFDFYLMEGSVPKSPFSDVLEHTIFALSSAAGNGHFGIYIDGIERSAGTETYNIVSLGDDGRRVEASRGFNMYAQPEEGYRMLEFIRSLPERTFIVAAIKTGPGVFFPPAAGDVLRTFGSVVSNDPQVLTSHAMIGRKGLQPGDALEAQDVNLGAYVTVFDSSLYVDPGALDTAFAGASGRAAVLSGTGPDDAIIIYTPSR